MLWYKGWLETRFLVVLLLAFAVFPILFYILLHTLVAPHAPNAPQLSVAQAESFIQTFAWAYALVPLLLAGSGIKTQWPIRKGLHESIYFTLSLPVSRFRLFATRAGLGMLETVGIFAIACGMWILFIGPEHHVSRSDMFGCWVSLSVCASAFYFFGVLLSTFLDEQVRAVANIVLLFWLLSKVPLPAPVNIFRAMVSPLFTHSFPWGSVGISLGIAAVLGSAAWRVVQTREY